MRDPSATAQRLTALKELGVSIAVDDFGTGYSSLAYLSAFPIDTLKIDRSFINGISTSSDSAALVNTLVKLAKTLRLNTVAEGIETDTQLSALKDLQCEHGQGYLLGRPQEPHAIQALLNNVPTTAEEVGEATASSL